MQNSQTPQCPYCDGPLEVRRSSEAALASRRVICCRCHDFLCFITGTDDEVRQILPRVADRIRLKEGTVWERED